MAANSTFPILTPDTPLAFLPRDVGLQYEGAGYLSLAVLSAFIWDILSTIPDDVKMLRISKFGLPIITYVFSRVITLAYLAMSTIYQVAPLGNCRHVQIASGTLYGVSVTATAALFILRIVAVFHGNRVVINFFLFTWFLTLGSSIIVPFYIGTKNIGPTLRCINTDVGPVAGVGTIVNTLANLLVFIALSWRLALNGTTPGLTGRSQSLIHGTGLPIMSKVLLQSGQLFYLTTVSFNILTLVMGIAPSISPTFHGIFPMPNIALENVMACRVFRALRLGLLGSDSDSDPITGRSLVGTALQPNGREPARPSNITSRRRLIRMRADHRRTRS
ncbi:hypothetical protein DFH07DRAFT_790807 [Mycena maculata]|uniref:Uncharacterized protein n=1 Tax=Mycena maculata TaxID=230809 RepID=A0AAD7KDI0_9AGAR|nr:hypothetical protein DFH07DRAFT_790807 [Mycena maculata]